MKPWTTLPLLAAAPLLAGCIIIADGETSAGIRYDLPVHSAGAGSVFGAEVAADAVSFRVRSNGCTDEGSFAVDADEMSDNRDLVVIDRVRADTCDARVPDGVVVRDTFGTLGIPAGARVDIGNPVRRHEGA